MWRTEDVTRARTTPPHHLCRGHGIPDARTRADGSLPDAAGSYETNSVEMQGKLDGKNVYLTAEVSDGLPGDDQPLTRGTR